MRVSTVHAAVHILIKSTHIVSNLRKKVHGLMRRINVGYRALYTLITRRYFRSARIWQWHFRWRVAARWPVSCTPRRRRTRPRGSHVAVDCIYMGGTGDDPRRLSTTVDRSTWLSHCRLPRTHMTHRTTGHTMIRTSGGLYKGLNSATNSEKLKCSDRHSIVREINVRLIAIRDKRRKSTYTDC